MRWKKKQKYCVLCTHSAQLWWFTYCWYLVGGLSIVVHGRSSRSSLPARFVPRACITWIQIQAPNEHTSISRQTKEPRYSNTFRNKHQRIISIRARLIASLNKHILIKTKQREVEYVYELFVQVGSTCYLNGFHMWICCLSRIFGMLNHRAVQINHFALSGYCSIASNEFEWFSVCIWFVDSRHRPHASQQDRTDQTWTMRYCFSFAMSHVIAARTRFFRKTGTSGSGSTGLND